MDLVVGRGDPLGFAGKSELREGDAAEALSCRRSVAGIRVFGGGRGSWTGGGSR